MEDSGVSLVDWFSIAGSIAGILALFLSVVFRLGPSAAEARQQLDADPTFRADVSIGLRDGALGQRYRDGLQSGLVLLDRLFGPPGSARALGFCIVIALVYALAGFVLV